MTWCDSEGMWENMMSAGVHHLDAYAYVERHARDFLEQHRGAQFATLDLIEGLYSGSCERTDRRIQSALNALALHGLRDYWEAVPRTITGRPRKVWRAPDPKKCPHCGGGL